MAGVFVYYPRRAVMATGFYGQPAALNRSVAEVPGHATLVKRSAALLSVGLR